MVFLWRVEWSFFENFKLKKSVGSMSAFVLSSTTATPQLLTANIQTPPVAPSALAPTTNSAFFTLLCTGQIESCVFPGYENVYCKFSFNQGQDWIILSVSLS